MDYHSKHRRLKRSDSIWTDKQQIYSGFDTLFRRYQDSILVVSYRSDGIPSKKEIEALLKQYKSKVDVLHYGQYKYVLSTNGRSEELLFIGR